MTAADDTAPLVPVAFRKGRASAPRLSKPRVVGRHSSRFWSEDEMHILRETFPKAGAPGCAPLLPRRGRASIYTMAGKLGLSAPNIKPRRIRRLSADELAELDAKVRQAWPDLVGKGAFRRFCEGLGIARHIVGRRAELMGLVVPRFKEAEWTDAETALLRMHAAKSLDYITTVFRKHGFPRATTAIFLRIKRLRLDRTDPNHLTGTALAKLLGVDNKTTTQWCVQGLIKAGRRGTVRLPQQGGDWWWIPRTEARRFIVENLERIDIRKVDKHDFVDLLVNDPPAAVDGAGADGAP